MSLKTANMGCNVSPSPQGVPLYETFKKASELNRFLVMIQGTLEGNKTSTWSELASNGRRWY
jgi:hypothetical protein